MTASAFRSFRCSLYGTGGGVNRLVLGCLETILPHVAVLFDPAIDRLTKAIQELAARQVGIQHKLTFVLIDSVEQHEKLVGVPLTAFFDLVYLLQEDAGSEAIPPRLLHLVE